MAKFEDTDISYYARREKHE